MYDEHITAPNLPQPASSPPTLNLACLLPLGAASTGSLMLIS